MAYKTVFMGSPDFAVRILAELNAHFEVCGVVTQPDKPAGRGKRLTPPPVKQLALELGLPMIQPEKMKDAGVLEQLVTWNPDFIVVAAFGRILRQNVLDLPRFGCINVHASYLPRWRGAAPIQAAILHGDSSTGVTIMKMDAGVDTGPILAIEPVGIAPDDTFVTLTAKLAQAGSRLLIKALGEYLDGSLLPTTQLDEGVTYAPMINKEDGLMDFTQAADSLERKVRAFIDWPGAYLMLDGEALKVRKARVLEVSGIPGTREVCNGYPCVSTSVGKLMLLEVKPAGRNWMSGSDFLRGERNWL